MNQRWATMAMPQRGDPPPPSLPRHIFMPHPRTHIAICVEACAVGESNLQYMRKFYRVSQKIQTSGFFGKVPLDNVGNRKPIQ